jgi:hypothetical protein
MVCDDKSELGNVLKSANHDPAKNADVAVQKCMPFGLRNNQKSDKQRKFANVAIQKPRYRKAHPVTFQVPLTNRTVTIGDSESDSEEFAQYYGVIQAKDLGIFCILTAHNNESALGSAFSRFQ